MAGGLSGGPLDGEGLWRLSFCKGEVEGAGILGRETFAERFLDLPGAFVGVDGDTGAYGVAIADGASELESQDVAVFTVLFDAISEDAEAGGIGTGEGDVEPAVLIEVKGGEGAGIFLAIDSADE
jgi:hypothetical protein